MHIKKLNAGTVWNSRLVYLVHYQGFLSSGPDLGACIAACHAAATR